MEHCTVAQGHYTKLSFYFNPADRYEVELKPDRQLIQHQFSPSV